jgi:hypothetical protein
MYLTPSFLKHMQESLPVAVVKEDRPPLVASGRHMVHGPFVLNSLRPRHAARIPIPPSHDKKKNPPPMPLKLKIRAGPVSSPSPDFAIRIVEMERHVVL